MEKRNLQKILAESESIRKAVEQGIPLEEAVELYLEVNRLVEEGKWIELHVRKPKHAEKLEQGTSVIRYWGSKELLGEEGYISTSKAKSLYEKGLIGKTHELVRGSDYHPKERELDPSMPPPGSRVYHRHWEIAEMYNYRKERRKKESFNILLGLALLSGVFFILLGLDTITGLSFFAFGTTNASKTIGILLMMLVIVVLFTLIRRTRY